MVARWVSVFGTVVLAGALCTTAFADGGSRLPTVKSPVGLKLATTKSQLSAGARCRIDALEAQFRQALKSAGPGTTPQSMLSKVNTGGSDTAALAYAVLMSATNDEDEDLKLIMAETKAQTNEKQALRDLMSSGGGSLEASMLEAQSMKLPPGPCGTAVMVMPTADPQIAIFRAKRLSISMKLSPSVLAKVIAIGHSPAAQPQALGSSASSVLAAIEAAFPGITPAQANLLALVAVEASLDAQLDSMSDMSQMTQMKLQMEMDQRSKFVEALSNIMKKIDSTQETIVQNLKG